jgi:molecular chaperone GrpE
MSIQPEDEKPMLPSDIDPQELHEQIQALNAAVQEAQEKAKENWDRLLRKEADLQNIQKRTQQELENNRKFAIERFAGDLLEVMDSLDQGVSFAQNGQASIKDLLHGMELTQTVLRNVLQKHGIELIDPKPGDAFDPNFHEALSMQPTDEMPPNCIVTIVQKGYLLQNRLLRPARVVVSKAA